jgi:hypothetical protein
MKDKRDLSELIPQMIDKAFGLDAQWKIDQMEEYLEEWSANVWNHQTPPERPYKPRAYRKD